MGLYVTFDGLSGTGKGAITSYCAHALRNQGVRVSVIEDRHVDPLRDLGARILPWCDREGISRNAFLLPLFAAGYCISDGIVERELSDADVVLRDRSFISSIGYVPPSGIYTTEQVFALYVEVLGLHLPDLAVIVDAPVTDAGERVAKRTKQDIGLGGKMAGDVAQRRAIRETFLDLPGRFGDRIRFLTVVNAGSYTDDAAARDARIAQAANPVLAFLAEKGVG